MYNKSAWRKDLLEDAREDTIRVSEISENLGWGGSLRFLPPLVHVLPVSLL
jgi:hypothetical protein